MLNNKVLQANKNLRGRNYWRIRMGDTQLSSWFGNGVAGEENPAFTYETLLVAAPAKTSETLDVLTKSAQAKYIVLLAAMGIFSRKAAYLESTCIFTPPLPGEDTERRKECLVPIRINNYNDSCFPDFLASFRKDLVNDFNYGDYPAEKIFDTNNINQLPFVCLQVKEIHKAFAADSFLPEILFDFSIADKLAVSIKFNTNKFNRIFISRLATLYFSLLERLINNSRASINSIPLINEDERLLQLRRLNTKTRVFHSEAQVSEAIDMFVCTGNGNVLNNMQAYILNKSLEMVPLGITGELYLAFDEGSNDEALPGWVGKTALVTNPFRPGIKMTGTGCLAMWTAEGGLIYAGSTQTETNKGSTATFSDYRPVAELQPQEERILSDLEMKLLEVWKAVLKKEIVGGDYEKNFFELGGALLKGSNTCKPDKEGV